MTRDERHQCARCIVEIPAGRTLCYFCRPRPPMVTEHPELGPVRYCRRCTEWWPLDAEFWSVVRVAKAGRPILGCRACQREWNRMGYEQRSA